MRNSIFKILMIGILMGCNAPMDTQYEGIVSEAMLKKHIQYLASDELMGRKANEEGYLMAAEYVKNYIEQIGLAPLFTDSTGLKVPGKWFQPVPFVESQYGTHNRIRLINGREYAIEENYFLLNSGKSTGKLNIDSICFVGYGIHEPDLGWNDFRGIDIKGKYVMITDGQPEQNKFPEVFEFYADPDQSLARKIEFLAQQEAAGLILISEASKRFWEMSALIHEKLGYKPVEKSFWADPYNPNLLVLMIHPDIFRAVYPLVDLKVMPEAYPEPYMFKSEIQLSVDVNERLFKAPNVAGIIEGTDSVLSFEYIIVGAHLDHIGHDGNKIFNGAIDNASSCAALMEVAKELTSNPCKRSVIFVFYTAEEPCLWGSQYFVSHLPIDKSNIAMNINVEMIGKAEKRRSYTTAIGPEKFAHYFNDRGPLTIDYLDLKFHQDRFRGSDQYSYFKKDIPAVRFGNLDYKEKHTHKDNISIVDFTYLQKATATLFEVIEKIAND